MALRKTRIWFVVVLLALLSAGASLHGQQTRLRFPRSVVEDAYRERDEFERRNYPPDDAGRNFRQPYGEPYGRPPFDPYALSPDSTLGAPAADAPYAPQAPAGYGDPAFNVNPSSQFPNGFGPVRGPNLQWPTWPGGGVVFTEPLRLVQGPRLRHTWLPGFGGRELQVHDSDVSAVVSFPKFLFSSEPLYVIPSFSLHQWDGPKSPPFLATSDLPSKTYSAFLDLGWESNRERILGVELGGRVGVFTDFNTINNDSLRVLGKGILRYQITPTLSIRGGVLYVNRVRIKLLPAGGVLWEPNPQTRFDIYFPNPKLSQYLSTVGNHDVWWYLSGEYGGGHWTIKRAVDGMSDRFDYNDIRVAVGMEWGPPQLMRSGRRLGFLEAAWVTEREVLYVRRPGDNFRPDDTLMIRAGIGY